MNDDDLRQLKQTSSNDQRKSPHSTSTILERERQIRDDSVEAVAWGAFNAGLRVLPPKEDGSSPAGLERVALCLMFS